jgi:hypothetical protein
MSDLPKKVIINADGGSRGNPENATEEPANSPLSAAWQHWMIVARFSREIPEVCWADNAINDFQKAQCHEFWSRLRFGWLVGLIPWFSLALFLWGAQRSIARVYAQADEKIRRGRADHQAVVTAPPQAPLDWFAWFYGLRLA